MQNPRAPRPLSSFFGTVSMNLTIQALDILALDNLFAGTPARAPCQKLPKPQPLQEGHLCMRYILFYLASPVFAILALQILIAAFVEALRMLGINDFPFD